MNDSHTYTFAVQDPETKIITMACYRVEGKIEIIPDVLPDRKMWVEVGPLRTVLSFYPDYLKIHVHSGNNIEGGGWDHGKNGKGNTQVIK